MKFFFIVFTLEIILTLLWTLLLLWDSSGYVKRMRRFEIKPKSKVEIVFKDKEWKEEF